MEKRRAHYPLNNIKDLVKQHGVAVFTRTAQVGVVKMGLSAQEAVDVVLGLTRSQLYKSMTTHADHRVWQDVYHADCPNGKRAYIKLTLREGAVVIQFKEV